MNKIFLLFSLLICNFAFSQDTLVVPTKPMILNALEIKKQLVKIHLSEPGSDSITVYIIDKNNKIETIKYKLLKF